jgi:hypothetical protein
VTAAGDDRGRQGWTLVERLLAVSTAVLTLAGTALGLWGAQQRVAKDDSEQRVAALRSENATLEQQLRATRGDLAQVQQELQTARSQGGQANGGSTSPATTTPGSDGASLHYAGKRLVLPDACPGFVDFDLPRVVNAGSDLLYCTYEGNTGAPYVRGALSAEAGQSPDRAHCEDSANTSPVPIMPDLRPGTTMCIRTNQQRIVWAKVVSVGVRKPLVLLATEWNTS